MLGEAFFLGASVACFQCGGRAVSITILLMFPWQHVSSQDGDI